MLLTEEEAKTKECRAGGVVQPMPPAAPAQFFNCVASGCAQWRWRRRQEITPSPSGHGASVKELTPTHGYCGLAGKPE